jgi:hypothetical protein
MFSRKTDTTGDKINFTGYFFALSLLVLAIKMLTLYLVNPTLTDKEIIISSAYLFSTECDFLLRIQTTFFYFAVAFLTFFTLRKNEPLATITSSLLLLWPTATYSGLFIIEPTSAAHLSTFLLVPFTSYIIFKYSLNRVSKYILTCLFLGLLLFSLASNYFYKNNNQALREFDFMLNNKVANHFVEGVKTYINTGTEKKIYIEEYSIYLTSKRYVNSAEVIHASEVKPEPNTLYISNSRSTENELIQKFNLNFEYSGTIDFEPYDDVRFLSTVYMVNEFKTEDKPVND